MKKIKLSRLLIVILIFIILFLGIFLIIKNLNSSTYKLKKLQYSKESIEEIMNNKIEKNVLNNKYSKTLDVALSSDEYENQNLDLYLEVGYIDEDDYIKKLNILSKLGYSINEIKDILQKISYDDLDYITNFEYISNLKDYLKYENFLISNLDRYITYSKNNDLEIENIILNVNMNLDKKEYVDYNIIDNSDSNLILVNKYNRLSDDYKPSDLEKISSNYSTRELYLKKEARTQFELMCTDAKSLGLKITAISAYRTSDYQAGLYNDYVYKNGALEADTYSARPRFSEHETGLAVDVMGSNGVYTKFENTEEFNWVKENLYNYGFIFRYPKGKENITKYIYESWHLRYVGKDIAKYIYDNNLTLEEYIALNQNN